MRNKHELILIDGVDKTDSIASIAQEDDRYRIVFQNSEKEYTYQQEKVQRLKQQRRVDPAKSVITVEGQIRTDLTAVQDYGPVYRLESEQGIRICPREDVSVEDDVLAGKRAAGRMDYFRSLAAAISLKSEDGFNILEHQYGKIRQVRAETALGYYLDPRPIPQAPTPPEGLLYPFGMNRSQKKAVENAFSSPVSIIEGPPGTGKTQTILNILANAVMNGKTVAVVSGNNSATLNVAEKLQKQKLDFLTTFLGSRANKDAFLAAQTGKYPSMRGWKLPDGEAEALRERMRVLSEELNRQLGNQNRIAAIRQQLLELKPERRDFALYYAACPKISNPKQKLFLTSEKILGLLAEYEAAAREQKNPGTWEKLRMLYLYHLQALRLMKEPPEAVVPYLQSEFYRIRTEELRREIKLLESGLKNYGLDEKLQELTEGSMKLLKNTLVHRFRYSKPRRIFDPGELVMKSGEFLQEYPVVLSTTYSVKSCLGQNVLYDYLIVDEASQVDLATGVLALSCARNVIIVGDQKQLPNVLTAENVRIAEGFWDPKLGNGYCYQKHSLLSSVSAVWKDAPSVLLREHYRCNPKIIQFCNQEFYDGRLIALTEDHGEPEVLSLHRTAPGNHAQGHLNRREANDIQNEVLPGLRKAGIREIGVIAPYRDQVELLQTQLPDKIEIDTVHKFQGREKDAIVLSSVDHTIGAFVNDEHLVNVAVSRAVRSLTVVTSTNPGNDATLYGDLARYISDQNGENRARATNSVFGLLAQEYTDKRREYLRKHRKAPELKAETQLETALTAVLRQPEFRNFRFAAHVPLGALIRDRALLTDEERKVLLDPLTHVDAVIFHRMDRAPLLAIGLTDAASRQNPMAHICETVGLPLLRIGSGGERAKIESALREARNRREGM